MRKESFCDALPSRQAPERRFDSVGKVNHRTRRDDAGLKGLSVHSQFITGLTYSPQPRLFRLSAQVAQDALDDVAWPRINTPKIEIC